MPNRVQIQGADTILGVDGEYPIEVWEAEQDWCDLPLTLHQLPTIFVAAIEVKSWNVRSSPLASNSSAGSIWSRRHGR